MNKVIEDLQWLYKILDKGGKTPKFYEAQKDIILQALVVLNKQTEKQIRADAIEEVKSKMISFHTDAIFQYGADIIEARADAFDELKDWVEEQNK